MIQNIEDSEYFNRTYYKVINFDTKEVIHEKEFLTKIANMLGIKSNTIVRNSRSKKGYYTHGKTKTNLKFIKIE
jgi:hypothetical protein